MESDEGKDEAFEVLDEVVKDAQPFRVVALLYVQQRPDLGALANKKRPVTGDGQDADREDNAQEPQPGDRGRRTNGDD